MAALEAGNMVDLDSNLTKLIEIVAIHCPACTNPNRQ
jgi:high-affinity K+ transport system ATPase subunit B